VKGKKGASLIFRAEGSGGEIVRRKSVSSHTAEREGKSPGDLFGTGKESPVFVSKEGKGNTASRKGIYLTLHCILHGTGGLSSRKKKKASPKEGRGFLLRFLREKGGKRVGGIARRAPRPGRSSKKMGKRGVVKKSREEKSCGKRRTLPERRRGTISLPYTFKKENPRLLRGKKHSVTAREGRRGERGHNKGKKAETSGCGKGRPFFFGKGGGTKTFFEKGKGKPSP